MLISATEVKKGKRRGVREEAEFNVFQLSEKKQSSALEYLQGRGWDAGGTHMWWFGSWDPGKPP